MTTVNGYALTGTSPECSAVSDVIDGKALESLAGLMPQGKAWPRDLDAEETRLVLALSHEYSRVRRRGRRLLEELDPRTTFELLTDWERVYGITPASGATIASRRQALWAKMLRRMGQTKAHYTALAASVGANDVEFSGYPIATCASACTASLYDWHWRSAWLTTVYGAVDHSALESAFLAARQLHTYPLFTYADLMSWFAASVAGSYAISKIAYGGGKFVGVGGAGSIVVINNGVVSRPSSGTTEDLNDVAYCATTGTWIACGGTTVVRSANGGSTWVATDLSETFNGWLLAIGANSTTWAAIGESGAGVASNNDGASWGNIDLECQDVYAVAGTSAGFLALSYDGLCRYSTNLTSWSSVDTGLDDGLDLAIDVATGHVMAIGSQGVAYSANTGAAWTPWSIPDDSTFLRYCCHNDDGSWSVVDRDSGAFYVTDDGETWETLVDEDHPSVDVFWACVAQHDDAWVVPITDDSGVTVIHTLEVS